MECISERCRIRPSLHSWTKTIARQSQVQNSISVGKLVSLVSIVGLLVTGLCFSQATIDLSKSSLPPTRKILISDQNFPANAAVVIHFDGTKVGQTTSDDSRSFSDATLRVQKNGLPGKHDVVAEAPKTRAKAEPGFLLQTNWTQFLFVPRGGRHNPYESVLNPTTVRNMILRWSHQTGGSLDSSPAVVNGIVYVGSYDNHVYALNAKTSTLLWKYTTGGRVRSSPAVASGVVFAGAFDNNVYALNARTGALLWKYTTGSSVVSSPTVGDGIVYVGSWDHNVYALSASTGAVLWSYTPISACMVRPPLPTVWYTSVPGTATFTP